LVSFYKFTTRVKKKTKQNKTKKTKKQKTLKMTKIECFFRKIVFRGDFNFPQFLG